MRARDRAGARAWSACVACVCACGPSSGKIDEAGSGAGTGTGQPAESSSTTDEVPDMPTDLPMPVSGCGDGVATPGEVCFDVEPRSPSADGAAMGDVNEDGHLDLVMLTTQPCDNEFRGYHVRTYAGDGTGELATVQEQVLPSFELHGLALVDVNGDASLDLVVSGSDGLLHVLAGDGTGAISLSASVTVGAQSGGLAAGDLEGDGAADVLVGTHAGIVRVFADGAGGYASELVDAGVIARSVRLADIDADGVLDLVAIDAAEVRVRLGLGAASFAAPETYDVPIGDIRSAAIGDLDDDGAQDVVVSGNQGFAFLAGAPGGLAPAIVHAGEGVREVRVGRFDGDLVDDAFVSTDEWRVALGQAGGLLELVVPDVGVRLESILATGDLNEDGFDDALLWWESCELPFGNVAQLLLSDP